MVPTPAADEPLSEMDAWRIAKNLVRIVSREVCKGDAQAIAFLKEASKEEAKKRQ